MEEPILPLIGIDPDQGRRADHDEQHHHERSVHPQVQRDLVANAGVQYQENDPGHGRGDAQVGLKLQLTGRQLGRTVRGQIAELVLPVLLGRDEKVPRDHRRHAHQVEYCVGVVVLVGRRDPVLLAARDDACFRGVVLFRRIGNVAAGGVDGARVVRVQERVAVRFPIVRVLQQGPGLNQFRQTALRVRQSGTGGYNGIPVKVDEEGELFLIAPGSLRTRTPSGLANGDVRLGPGYLADWERLAVPSGVNERTNEASKDALRARIPVPMHVESLARPDEASANLNLIEE
uniref:Uncharacterized protein n=1 Tax=Anopheles atroparvus TaxID=41427 RepID=A0A182JJD2_ANOAO